MNPPSASGMSMNGSAGSPSFMLALNSATLTTVWPPELPASTRKLPVMTWSITVRSTPVPTTRTYCPASSARSSVPPPIANDSSTARPVVLTSTVRLPVKNTLGTSRVTCPEKDPATPAASTMNSAEPPLTVTSPSPSDSDMFAAPTRTTCDPPVVCFCSKAKSPLRRWPMISTVTPSPATRRYLPADRSRTT